VVLRVVRSPLVSWVWVAGFIMAFGTAFALIPSRRGVRGTQRTPKGSSLA
jgi:hypothetical protein